MTAEIDMNATFIEMLRRRLEQLAARLITAGSPMPQTSKEQALCALEYGLAFSATWPQTRQLLLALAPRMEQAGHRDDLLAYLQTGMTICDAHHDLATKARLAYLAGYIHQIRGRYSEAVTTLHLSATLSMATHNIDQWADARNRLAYVAYLQGRYRTAVALAKSTLVRLERSVFSCQFSYFVLGAVAFEQERWATAAGYFRRSLRICQQSGADPRLVALRQGNLATAYSHWKQYDKALPLFESAIAALQQLGDVFHVAVMQMNLGNALLELAAPHRALVLYAESVKIMVAVGDQRHLALLYLNRGRAYRELADIDAAIRYLTNSIERWQELDSAYGQANATYELGLTQLVAGENHRATTAFHRALSLLGSTPRENRYQELRASIHAALSASGWMTNVDSDIGVVPL